MGKDVPRDYIPNSAELEATQMSSTVEWTKT